MNSFGKNDLVKFKIGPFQNWQNRGENQTLVRAILFCGDYPVPRFEDKFRPANQIDGI